MKERRQAGKQAGRAGGRAVAGRRKKWPHAARPEEVLRRQSARAHTRRNLRHAASRPDLHSLLAPQLRVGAGSVGGRGRAGAHSRRRRDRGPRNGGRGRKNPLSRNDATDENGASTAAAATKAFSSSFLLNSQRVVRKASRAIVVGDFN